MLWVAEVRRSASMHSQLLMSELVLCSCRRGGEENDIGRDSSLGEVTKEGCLRPALEEWR